MELSGFIFRRCLCSLRVKKKNAVFYRRQSAHISDTFLVFLFSFFFPRGRQGREGVGGVVGGGCGSIDQLRFACYCLAACFVSVVLCLVCFGLVVCVCVCGCVRLCVCVCECE